MGTIIQQNTILYREAKITLDFLSNYAKIYISIIKIKGANMAQAKKKTATRTTKKTATRAQAQRKAATRTTKYKSLSGKEKLHIYVITAMSIIAGILLCANAAMMIV